MGKHTLEIFPPFLNPKIIKSTKPAPFVPELYSVHAEQNVTLLDSLTLNIE